MHNMKKNAVLLAACAVVAFALVVVKMALPSVHIADMAKIQSEYYKTRDANAH